MSDLLAGCLAKIQRADESIKNLNSEITAFLGREPKPYQIARRLQNEGRQYAFVATGDPSVPPRFAVLAGEIIHHLRSSLDHLICALVIKGGSTPNKSHQFPICVSLQAFEESRKRGQIAGISPSSEKLVRSVQPYTSATPDDTVLHAIQQYDNLDKHQLLLFVTTVAHIGDKITIGAHGKAMLDENGNMPAITGFGDPSPRRVSRDGTVIFTIDLAEPTPSFEAQAEFVSQIAFEKCGRVECVPVIRILTGLLQGTAHTVSLFNGEF